MAVSDAIVPTPDQLRGISHPVRIKLLGLLRLDGPQTSADLARATGLNTGATSYHLRQLAQHGFIEEASDLGTGRERVWRARHRSTQPVGPPDALGTDASVDDQSAWRQTVVTWTSGTMQAAQDEWTDLPAEWRAATTFSDWALRIRPDRAMDVLRQLLSTLDQLTAEYAYDAGRGDERSSADSSGVRDGTELWEVHLLAFPVPGRIPHRDE